MDFGQNPQFFRALQALCFVEYRIYPCFASVSKGKILHSFSTFTQMPNHKLYLVNFSFFIDKLGYFA